MSELRLFAGAGAGPEPDSAATQRHGPGHQGRPAQGPGGQRGRQQDVEQRQAEVA